MMLLPPSFPITYRPDLQKALTGFLRFIAQSVSIAILSFSANLTVFYDCSCDGNRKQKHKITWYPPPPFTLSCPADPSASGRLAGVDFSLQSIHFNHNGQRREHGERRANWLAGICIYSTQQNVTTGLGDDLCGLLAKQTDEGNLSCCLCSTEQGQPRPLLLASSVTCHAVVAPGTGKTRGVNRRVGGRDGDIEAEREEMMCCK